MESKKPTTKYLVKLMLKSSDNNPYTGKLSLSANIFAAIQLAELCKTFSLVGQQDEAMYVSSNQWEEVIDRLKEYQTKHHEQNWLDVYLGKYKWYRKMRGGYWHKHQFTKDARELTFDEGVTFWAKHGEINRYSIVIEQEIY